VRRAFLQSLVFLLFASSGTGLAGNRLESGKTQVSLLELYTSEGCSSCPRAEVWVGQYHTVSAGWRSLVPVAFHVDYWDQLGWKDRFAKPEFTLRQQSYAAGWRNGSVYTPCFILNGKEWKGWFLGANPPTGSETVVGNLEATIENGRVDVRFSPAMESRQYEVFVAPLAMETSSDVAAGENRGRHLKHDFVVLSLAKSKLEPDTRGSDLVATLPFSTSGAGAIAVWVTEERSLAPIQAVGGPLE
jgi:hypothetical protein